MSDAMMQMRSKSEKFTHISSYQNGAVTTSKFTKVWKALQHPNSMSIFKFGSNLKFGSRILITHPFGPHFDTTCSKHVPSSSKHHQNIVVA